MKQNEKILVYVVTGFLFVILAVAVIFGRDGKTPERQTGSAPSNGASSLEDVLNNAKLLNAQPPVPDANLTANVQLGPPTPAEEVAALIGPSRHERDCRVVTARIGDSLGGLVQRWCGSAEALPLAERMNEEAQVLRPGQDVWLPWIEDAEVLDAFGKHPPKAETAAPPGGSHEPKNNGKGAGKGAAGNGVANAKNGAGKDKEAAPATGHGKAGEAAASGVRTYVIKPGDKLWAIAEQEVGKAKAHAFLQRVKELNPELDLDHLKVAQAIKLPGRS